MQNIVPNPYDYIQTVLRLGHDVSVEGKNIDEILPAQQMMTLSVALTGAISNALSMDEMNSILDGCKICLTFINFRKEAVNCIELFMEQLAPNVTMLVGTEIAANLVALAGGMIPLSRVPACNVLLIGKKQKILSGFSKINDIPESKNTYLPKLSDREIRRKKKYSRRTHKERRNNTKKRYRRNCHILQLGM